MSLLSLNNFGVSFKQDNEAIAVVHDLNLEIGAGEIVAIIGESGSGKSVTAQSITKLIPQAVIKGSCTFNDKDILGMSATELNAIRTHDIAYIFQEPMTALNPIMTCGDQIKESSNHDTSYLHELMAKVELPDPKRMLSSYPHELSGGQRQRIMIAMALAKNPKLLIADEPTTALDSAVQQGILDLIKNLSKTENMAVLFITHDLVSLRNFADSTAVMYKGSIVEHNKTDDLLTNPKHQYTKALIESRATYAKRKLVLAEVEDLLNDANYQMPKRLPIKSSDMLVLQLKNIHKSHYQKGIFSKTETKVLYGIDFEINEGDCIGLIGESGSGKSTIAKLILSIWNPTEGSISFKNKPLEATKNISEQIQMVFQDPFSSLNPKHKIGKAIEEVCKSVHSDNAKHESIELLKEVGLQDSDYNKYPHEFSGGQRQRICIAKALAKKPELIVLDEAVSALDVSVQAKILNLLDKLKQERNLTYILISHDLNVVSYFCNKIVVLKEGSIIEEGTTDDLINKPKTLYTKELLKHSTQ